jgi:DNA-binding NarL/FixJ family response regulator
VWLKDVLGSQINIIHARSLSECHRSGECDVALLDLNLENTIGVDTVKKFHAGIPHLPIVILTQVNDQKLKEECLSAGANAFYQKNSLDPQKLIESIRDAVEKFYDYSEHKEIKLLSAGIMKRLSVLASIASRTEQ